MKKSLLILSGLLFLVSGCKPKNGSQDSGSVTINNTLSGSGPYYAMGFSVPTGKLVSTLNSPLDVITIQEDHDINLNVRKLLFVCENFNASFFKYGEYADGATAKTAFDNMKTFTLGTLTELADSVKVNQVWIFKTSEDKYAKIRVTDTKTGPGSIYPYVECTLEWVYQPDGTKIFP